LLGGFAAGQVLQISVAISGALLLVFASNTALIGTYNVFLSLAKLRFLPLALTKTNRWRKTPHVAILVATAVPVGVVVFSGGNVMLLGDLYAFGLLGAFSVTCVALDLVRFHERHIQRLGNEVVNVGRIRFILGVITTVLVSSAWITNLFAKPLATLFGGGVTLVGIGIAYVTYRRARRHGPSVIFPQVHHHQEPVVFMSRVVCCRPRLSLHSCPPTPSRRNNSLTWLRQTRQDVRSPLSTSPTLIAPELRLPRCSRSSTRTGMTSLPRTSSPKPRPLLARRASTAVSYMSPLGPPRGLSTGW